MGASFLWMYGGQFFTSSRHSQVTSWSLYTHLCEPRVRGGADDMMTGAEHPWAQERRVGPLFRLMCTQDIPFPAIRAFPPSER